MAVTLHAADEARQVLAADHKVARRVANVHAGQSFIVDNKPGASGNLSAGDVIKAAPDGYTLLIAPTSVETANPSLFKATFQPSKDLAPGAAIGRAALVLVAKPGFEAKDAKELVAMAKAKPGKVKLLVVASAQRSPFFPDMPTLAEQGIKGAELDIWFGVWAPVGVPAEALTKLNAALVKVLAQPALTQRFGDLGAVPSRWIPRPFASCSTTKRRCSRR